MLSITDIYGNVTFYSIYFLHTVLSYLNTDRIINYDLFHVSDLPWEKLNIQEITSVWLMCSGLEKLQEITFLFFIFSVLNCNC